MFFDVKSQFTNIQLDYTINVILRGVCDDKELSTNISKKEMKELLLLITKIAHFTFNNEMHQQRDEVATGSRLGPVTFRTSDSWNMIELKKPWIPTLMEHMTPWKRYLDHTIADIKLISIVYVFLILNSFHQNIGFIYE